MFGREAKSKSVGGVPSVKEVKPEEKVQPVSKPEPKVSAGLVREPTVVPPSNASKPQEQTTPASKPVERAGYAWDVGATVAARDTKPEEPTPAPVKPQETRATAGWARDIAAAIPSRDVKPEEPAPTPFRAQEKAPASQARGDVAATVPTRDVKPEEPAPTPAKPQETRATGWPRDIAGTVTSRDVKPEEPVPTPVKTQERAPASQARDVAAAVPTRDVKPEESTPAPVKSQERSTTGLARDVAATVPTRDVRAEQPILSPVKPQETRVPTGYTRDVGAVPLASLPVTIEQKVPVASKPVETGPSAVPVVTESKTQVPAASKLDEKVSAGIAKGVSVAPSVKEAKSEERVPVVSRQEEKGKGGRLSHSKGDIDGQPRAGVGAIFAAKESAKPEEKTSSVAKPDVKISSARDASAGVGVTKSRPEEKVPVVEKPAEKAAPVRTGTARK